MPSRPACASPAAAVSSSGATADRQVAVGPRGRRPATPPRRARRSARATPSRHAAVRPAGVRRPSRRCSSVDDARAADEDQRHLGELAEHPAGRAEQRQRRVGASAHGAPGVGRLVERDRHPRQVQHERAAEARPRPVISSSRRAAPAGARTSRYEPRRRRTPRRRTAPSCACRAAPRAPRRSRSPTAAARARRRRSRTRARTRRSRPARAAPASAYIRVSCAYCVRNGFVAASTAAIQAARVPNSVCPPTTPTGTVSRRTRSDSARVASSDVPATCIQTCSSR